MKRSTYLNIGLSLGVDPVEIMRDMTPAETIDILALRQQNGKAGQSKTLKKEG